MMPTLIALAVLSPIVSGFAYFCGFQEAKRRYLRIITSLKWEVSDLQQDLRIAQKEQAYAEARARLDEYVIQEQP